MSNYIIYLYILLVQYLRLYNLGKICLIALWAVKVPI